MPAPTIDTLPTPPNRTDAPAQFNARADALLGALPGFVTQTNAVAAYVEGVGDGLDADVLAAETAATNAGVSETNAEAAAGEAEAARDEAVAAAQGGNISPLRYTVDTGETSAGDPGSGLLQFNNATQASATEIYLDDITEDSVDVSDYYDALGQSGFVTLVKATDRAVWRIYQITGISDSTGYRTLTVVSKGGAGSFSDEDVALVVFNVANVANVGGRESIPIVAGSMTPSTTSGCAALATVEISAGQPDVQSLDFASDATEYAQFSVRMPKRWNGGTITFAPWWSHGTADTNFGVVWSLQAVAISNDDAMGVSFGTAQTSTDTGGTANDVYVGPESSAITIAGTPASEDVVFYRIGRIHDNGSDTLAVDARLQGLTLYITTTAGNDA